MEGRRVKLRELLAFLMGAGLALLVVAVVTGPLDVVAAAIFVVGCGLAYWVASARVAR
jgi:Flp pilus assembly protein TadB